MKELKRGDRVKFLNDTGSGSVTRIIDGQMVMVRTDDGFEYPVLRSELILSSIDEPVADEKRIDIRTEPDAGGADDKGKEAGNTGNLLPEAVSGPVNLFIAVAPQYLDEPVGGEADIYLINDSPYFVLYHCSVRIGENLCETISAGTIEPDTKILLSSQHMDDIFGRGRGLGISIIPYGNGRQPFLLPVNKSIKPGREFMSSRSAYSENDYTDNDSFLVRIEAAEDFNTNEDIAEKLRESLASVSPSRAAREKPVVKPKKENNPEEVDLHIHEIMENTSGMTPGEIINVQLARFRTSLDGAINARQRKIVYIHGSGEGKLKHEIRRIIDREYPRCIYQDASFREYGYGATLVIIR